MINLLKNSWSLQPLLHDSYSKFLTDYCKITNRDIKFLTVFLPERHQKEYINTSGRSSDLLPCLNAFPFRFIETVAMEVFVQHAKKELTAAGTVADFHGIPFYFIHKDNYE